MSNDHSSAQIAEIERLSRELEEAELYEQKLRARIVAIRDQLAAGPPGARVVAVQRSAERNR